MKSLKTLEKSIEGKNISLIINYIYFIFYFIIFFYCKRKEKKIMKKGNEVEFRIGILVM